MITKDLIEFGFSDKEAKVYIALLRLEIASVYEISKQAEINRSTAYVILDALTKHGFVTISNDKNVKRYSAVSPEVLLRTAENNVMKCENIRNKIGKIIPEMMALHKDTRQKPIVKIYEGKEGLINALGHSLKSKEKFMRVYSSPGNLKNIISDYMQEYISKRSSLGIRMHGIHPDTKEHKELEIVREKFFGKKACNFDMSVLVPPENYTFPADLAIYDDTVGYMSSDCGGLAILIESKEMAGVMKNVFDLAWEEAKRVCIKK